MAIDWTPLVAAAIGFTHSLEYRVDDDGLVRWRGDVTMLQNGAYTSYVIPPVEARTTFVVLWDWEAGKAAVYAVPTSGGGPMYVGAQGGYPVGQVFSLGGLSYQGTAPPPAPPVAHSLENVVSGLAAALDAVPDLRVYPFPADQVEAPAVVLTLPDSPYSIVQGKGESYAWTFPLWAFVGKASDRMAAAELRAYLEPVGPRSIVQAIEADQSLGGACDSVSVLGVTTSIASVAGTSFLAAEFTLEVIG